MRERGEKMKKYPLKIVYTFALTNSVGIADPRNSISSAVLVIEDISFDKIKECINLIESIPYENGNNKGDKDNDGNDYEDDNSNENNKYGNDDDKDDGNKDKNKKYDERDNGYKENRVYWC